MSKKEKQGYYCDIETLRDTFKIGLEVFEESYYEGKRAERYYHDDQYTEKERNIIIKRKQPLETYNIFKQYSRLLLGYMHTRVTNVRFNPQQPDDTYLSNILTDLVDHVFRRNRMETEGDKIKLDFALTGLCCSYQIPVKTDAVDEFGRPMYEIKIKHVPASEIILDPMSNAEDYSDARFLHRHRWVSASDMKKLFPKKKKEIDDLPADSDINEERTESSLEYKFNHSFDGYHKHYKHHKLIHTVLIDEDDKAWSIYWSGETILEKQEITFRKVRFPYRVHKLHQSDRSEYYGLFREVFESQRALNQAIIKIQNLCNTTKVYVNKNKMKEGMDVFIRQVSGVSEVVELNGPPSENILIHERAKEIEDQYIIVEKTLERIQKVLGINDAFLGFGMAYDPANKTQMHKQAASMSLTYFVSRMEQFYRLVGEDIANYIQQYYKAHQIISLADPIDGQKLMELNKPILDENGEYVYEEVKNPEDDEPMIDDDGYLIYAPVPTMDSEIKVSMMDVSIDVISKDASMEQDRAFLEGIIQGLPGQSLLQYNPAAFFMLISKYANSLSTKSSSEIQRIFEETAYQTAGMPPPVLQQSNEKNPQSGNKIAQQPGGQQYK